jgi:RimJ/RimL family protein N-acetyltransferase
MIFGEKIRLRAVERDDLPRFTRWLNDPEVLEGLLLCVPMSLTDEEEWFTEVRRQPPDQRPLSIDLKTRGGWEHIGGTGLHAIDRLIRSAEFGIHIGEKKYWNKGAGTDATRTIVRYGFETLNLNRIWLRVYEFNRRAQRAYEKVGFTREGVQREGHFHQGRYWDILQYSILRREWDALRGGIQER